MIRTRHPLPIALLLCLIAGFALPNAQAASKVELDARVNATLERLYADRSEARALGQKAAAILVFPNIIKGGVGVGGEVGEGAFLQGKSITQYYRVTSLSFGFQLGGQAKSQVIMFMTSEAARAFLEGDGWEAGVDGSIAIVEFGMGETFDTNSVQDPIIAFVFNNKGLMYNLSLEGSKFWKINKS